MFNIFSLLSIFLLSLYISNHFYTVTILEEICKFSINCLVYILWLKQIKQFRMRWSLLHTPYPLIINYVVNTACIGCYFKTTGYRTPWTWIKTSQYANVHRDRYIYHRDTDMTNHQTRPMPLRPEYPLGSFLGQSSFP